MAQPRDVTFADLRPQAGHAFAALVPVHLDRVTDRALQGPIVVRVHEHGVGELLGGSGELRQHDHAVAVDVRGGVLLRHQVHPVTERRDEHDVTGSVESDQLVERQRLVQVVDHGEPDTTVLAVDLADQTLDLVAFLLVVLHAFPGGRGDLDHDVSLRIEHPGLEQRAERAESQADALRVVEPVDAEQDHLRVAEPRPDLGDALAGGASGGDLLDLVDVDRDREHSELDRPTVEHDDVIALGHVEELIGRGGEVGHTARGP